MTIGISCFGCDRGNSGISRYLLELLEAWAHRPDGDRFVLFGSPSLRPVFFAPGSPAALSPAFRWVDVGERWEKPVPSVFWHLWVLPGLCRREQIDRFFFPAANRRLGPGVPCPCVGTVHDLSSLHVKGKYSPANELYLHRLLPGLIRRLDGILSISGSTSRDLVSLLGIDPARITVIGHGVETARFAAGRPDWPRVREKLGLPEKFLLYISRIEHPGKNHVRLIRAFELLKTKTGLPHHLVLAGADWDRAAEVHRTAETSPWAQAIHFTGFLSGADLPGLYAGADLFVFPSLFEGFGMPLLEAMAAGVPVCASDTSSLPEVGGAAARYFDPESEESMARVLEAVLTDGALRQAMVEEGLKRTSVLTWEETARQTAGLIRSVVQDRRRLR